MPLFGKGRVTPQQAAPEGEETAKPQELSQQEFAQVISQGIVNALTPLLQQQAPPRPPPEPEPEPDEDDDPASTARFTKIATKVAQQQAQPYAHIFEHALPSVVRNQVVNNLNEGQKVIYNKYSKEVDAAIASASRNNPTAASNPEVHRKAIALVLGEHSDEIEELVLQRLRPEDLPKTFVFPNSNMQSAKSFEPTELQTQQRESYNISNPRRGWTEEDVAYWSDFKPGYWSDIVAQHKTRQSANADTNKKG